MPTIADAKDTTLIDINLEVSPKTEGLPETLHVMFDRNAVEYSEQYRDALYVSRGLPFNVEEVGPTDILTILVANTMGAKGALSSNDAVRRAQGHYKRWIDAADKDAWTLAILYDNVFTHQPTSYPEPAKPPPGITAVPEPKRDLKDPVEFRLKQIVDLFNVSREFRTLVERTINDVLTKMAQYGEAVKQKDSFRIQQGATDSSVSETDVSTGRGEDIGGGNGQDGESPSTSDVLVREEIPTTDGGELGADTEI